MRCAVVDVSTGIVSNVIIADPATDPAPSGSELISLPEDSEVFIGWVYSNGSFSNPDAP